MGDDKGFGAGTVLLSFLIGGIVGAGLAAFLTPVSGPEARQRIRRMKDELVDKAEGYVHEAKDYAQHKQASLKSAYEAGKEAYEREKAK